MRQRRGLRVGRRVGGGEAGRGGVPAGPGGGSGRSRGRGGREGAVARRDQSSQGRRRGSRTEREGGKESPTGRRSSWSWASSSVSRSSSRSSPTHVGRGRSGRTASRAAGSAPLPLDARPCVGTARPKLRRRGPDPHLPSLPSLRRRTRRAPPLRRRPQLSARGAGGPRVPSVGGCGLEGRPTGAPHPQV